MATDTPMLAKSIFALFVIVLLVTLIAQQPPPGSSLPPSNTSLTQLQSDFSQNFPTFNNPFQQSYLAATMLPAANASGVSSALTHGCANNASYWQCVSTEDGNASYIRLPNNYLLFTVRMSNVTAAAGLEITNLVFTVECSQDNAQDTWQVSLSQVQGSWTGTYPNNAAYNFKCNEGGGGAAGIESANFTRLSITLAPVCTSIPANSYCIWYANNLTALQLTIARVPLSNGIGEADFTYLSLQAYANSQPPCTGDAFQQIGCQVGRFFGLIANGLIFIFNGIIFIGSILVWFIGLIGGFVSVFVGSLLWLVTIPGTPPIVSGILLGLVVMLLVVVVLTMAKLVRGTEG